MLFGLDHEVPDFLALLSPVVEGISVNASNKLFFWSLTSALAGFLFGFDTVVISGAEKTIQSLWQLSDFEHGVAISSALWGTVLGSMIGQFPTDRYGRRKTLLWIGVLYLVSAVWSGLATGLWTFSIARFIGGVGVGISTVASPLYIAELSPPHRRGRLAGLFQFNIVLGILIALVSNAMIAQTGSEHAWRWMLGVEALPALVYTVMCLGLPESPRWLLAFRDDHQGAREVLRALSPEASPEQLDQDLATLTAGKEPSDPSNRLPHSPFWSRSLALPIAIAFLVAFFNQMSGVNAILYFAPRIFELTGLAEQAALLQSVGIGVTNLVFTFVGLWLIDRLGRKTLLVLGSFGYIASLGLCAWAFSTKTYWLVPGCIFAFIAAHAMGQGAVIWVLISEIFPDQHRANGQALGSFTHWIFAALLTLVFPIAVTQFAPEVIFGFFCFMMFLHLLWVFAMVRETKGVPLT